jgi:hypothetical protein
MESEKVIDESDGQREKHVDQIQQMNKRLPHLDELALRPKRRHHLPVQEDDLGRPWSLRQEKRISNTPASMDISSTMQPSQARAARYSHSVSQQSI